MKQVSLWLLGLFLFLHTQAQKFPDKPSAFVNDYAELLTAEEEQQLNVLIRQIADSTSNEIAVAIFPNAQGYEFSDFAMKVARTWGIGNKERNNGVLIALFMNERGYSFQVGKGLEGVLTDLTTRRIFNEHMKPAFRKGDYFSGLSEAILVTGKIASGEYKFANQYGNGEIEGKDIAGLVVLVVIFLVIFLIFLSRRGGGGGNRGGGLGAALPYLLMGSHFGRGHHSGWGGSGFGGGGGSFGGFGGGSFGGGGSSGSW
jgi:uncharacterized protein